ncbi:hypothetical protein FKM82_011598 [Ascaphus truei]
MKPKNVRREGHPKINQPPPKKFISLPITQICYTNGDNSTLISIWSCISKLLGDQIIAHNIYGLTKVIYIYIFF